ncbi:MAG: CBS domain-containing protein [Planctomycetota bacterium]|nr:CBS domain-containing protein [Planctomycetota bacterium]
MPVPPKNQLAKGPEPPGRHDPFRLLFFSELLKRPICARTIKNRLGKLTDLVFRLTEPYPEAVGIYVEHGWGKPTEFIPWEKLIKIDDDCIFVQEPPAGGYAPFVDQTGWILADKHLMGRTILDMDGRRTEVVNDVHLLETKGKLLIVHVDISFNGFLRRWGLARLIPAKDQFISWRYVQPLSLEDAGAKDSVSLSVTHKQMMELPGEDLADALETLSGKEQQAVFSALDTEKAAEVLVEAEPRAQRQLISALRGEKARKILSELSVPQLADLFSVLPHNDMVEMMKLLSKEDAERIQAIVSDRESAAAALMSADFMSAAKDATVGEVLRAVRASKRSHESISYIYVLGKDRLLMGVVDLRELVLADDNAALGDIMTSPVVSAQADDTREDLAEMFAKYHFRMVPIVDAHDNMLGVIHYKDIMRGLVTRARL